MRESSNVNCKTLAVDGFRWCAGKYKSREGYPAQPFGNLSQPLERVVFVMLAAEASLGCKDERTNGLPWISTFSAYSCRIWIVLRVIACLHNSVHE